MVVQRPCGGTLAGRRLTRTGPNRAARHIGLGSGLVDEDEAGGIDPILVRPSIAGRRRANRDGRARLAISVFFVTLASRRERRSRPTR